MSVTEPGRLSGAIETPNMLIHSARTSSATGETLRVQNPLSRSVIAAIPRGKAADVNRAPLAASRAAQVLTSRS